jgi:hypothetical protein
MTPGMSRNPRPGGAPLLFAVGMGEARAIRGDQVVTLGLRNRREEALPRAPEREDPAHDERAHAVRMRLRVREGQRASPRAAEHEPALDAEALAQPLGIGDEMPRRVGLERGVRRAAAASALIEQHDAIARGVEESPVVGGTTAAGPAVKKERGVPLGIAAHFPVHVVAIADGQPAVFVRLDRRVQRPTRHEPVKR